MCGASFNDKGATTAPGRGSMLDTKPLLSPSAGIAGGDGLVGRDIYGAQISPSMQVQGGIPRSSYGL